MRPGVLLSNFKSETKELSENISDVNLMFLHYFDKSI